MNEKGLDSALEEIFYSFFFENMKTSHITFEFF